MSADCCSSERESRIRRPKQGACAPQRSPVRLTTIVRGLMWIAIIGTGPLLYAQPNPQDANAPADDLQRLPSDRKIAQQLQELTRLADSGNLIKIRDTLQLLRSAEPALLVPAQGMAFRPLHRDLIERIHQFSPQLQTELLRDPGATPQSLQLAFSSGGPTGLLAFLHRYSGTTESLKAHLLMAAIHRDRGNRQATLYWLAPVMHETVPRELRSIAVAWSEELQAPEASLDSQLDDESTSHHDDQDGTEPDQPDQQRTQREIRDAAPNDGDKPQPENEDRIVAPVEESSKQHEDAPAHGSQKGVLSNAPAWQQKLYLSSAQRRSSQDLVRLLAASGDQQAIAWTAGEPLVEADVIYVRSSGGLLAYERLSGKVRWTRLLDRPSDVRRVPGGGWNMPDGIDRSLMEIEQLQNSRDVLDLHRDDVATRMTADLSRLFVICDTGESVGSADYGDSIRLFSGRIDQSARTLRELVAIEKASGRRLWSAGGVPMEERFGNELSLAWFAGPPTVSGSALYGVIERDDAHWLVCLRAETGEVIWKSILAFPETNIQQDPFRQLVASRPIVAEGLIWTNTSDGWLIAVDALTHTIIWSRNMIQRSSEISRIRNIRSAILQLQPLKPFRESWRPVSMQLLSDSLLLTGADSHQLFLIDPLTGKVRRRVSPANATVVVYDDAESVITAGTDKIERLNRKDLDTVWSTQLVANNAVPTGPGTRLGDEILLPLSDGSIQAVRYSDGGLSGNFPGKRPAFSAGGLTSVQGDVVSYGVDHVSLYAHSGSTVPQELEPIDKARFLIETGKFAEAKQVLENLQTTTEQADTIQRLLFRVTTALALSDESRQQEYLENAARFATTTLDKAIVEFLTLETRPKSITDTVRQLQAASPSVLNTELPPFKHLKSRLLNPIVDVQVRSSAFGAESEIVSWRPLRHTLLLRIEQQLVDAGSNAAEMDAILKQLSVEDLLSLNQPESLLQDELMNRAESAIEGGSLTESTLHLLLQARHCAERLHRQGSEGDGSAPDSEISNSRLQTLVDRFEAGLIAESARPDVLLRPHPAALNLLAVLRIESLPPSENAPDAVNPPDAENAPEAANARGAIAQGWAAWKEGAYRLLPVNPVASSNIPQVNERALSPRVNSDRFLSGWRWSTIREPSVLAVRSLLDPDQPLCTIDGGMFDALSFGNNGTVVRYGSVILVQNSLGLSAVSLMDQRVLWSRPIANQSASILWNMMGEMHLFDSFSTMSTAWEMIFGRDLRICGGNERWICLQTTSEIEMIDLLTGQNLWSRKLESSDQVTFATDSAVFLSSLTSALRNVRNGEGIRSVRDLNAAVVLSRIDGALLTGLRPTLFQLRRTILATNNELVIWNRTDFSSGPPTINWVDVESGEERRSITLDNMQSCHFLDMQTLVSTRSDDSFEVVDLLTGRTQIVPLNDDSELSEESKKRATEELPEKYIVAEDAANYYVFPVPDRQAIQMQIMLGSNGDLNLYPIHRELRAINRVTGKLRWIRSSEENTAAWFDATADPVLLLVTNTARKNKANGPPAIAIPGLVLPTDRKTTVTGLSRMSGNDLFDYQVSSRFPVPSLQFKMAPQGYLDLQAFGNRVRFVPIENDQPDGKPHAVD